MTSPFRLVQHGVSPLVVGYLCGDTLSPMLRMAIPKAAIVCMDEAPLHPMWQDIENAGACVGWEPGGDIVLVGYSAGCQSVRQHLLNGKYPRGIVCIDGTHASIPPQTWQIDTWRSLVAEARRKERIFVATCSQQIYVENLPVAERFMATRHVLEQAVGVELPPGTEINDGDLHVASFPSKAIDGPAHIHQARYVLPDVLRRFIAPLYDDEDETKLTDPTPAPNKSLGERLLDWYRAEQAAGVGEVPPGSNTSPRIVQYFAVCRRRGTEQPLGITAGAWCAACASFGLGQVALPGEAYPAPRAAGIEIEADADENGTWHPVEQVQRGEWSPEPGDLVLCKRGDVWQRHVCALVERVHDVLTTIGGNESNEIRVSTRSLSGGTEPIAGFVALERRNPS